MEDEISEYQVDISLQKGRHNNQKGMEDDESSQQQNKGWMSNLHRESRIDEKEYQAVIPDLLYKNEQERNQVFQKHKKLYEPYINGIQTYTYRNNLSDYEIKEYLNFARCISLKDNKNDSEGLLIGLPSTEQVEANALNFLAKCDYSIIKAKFYLVFPTLMYFNAYKSKIQKPIKLSEQDMQEKIDQFVSQLQETKLGYKKLNMKDNRFNLVVVSIKVCKQLSKEPYQRFKMDFINRSFQIYENNFCQSYTIKRSNIKILKKEGNIYAKQWIYKIQVQNKIT